MPAVRLLKFLKNNIYLLQVHGVNGTDNAFVLIQDILAPKILLLSKFPEV